MGYSLILIIWLFISMSGCQIMPERFACNSVGGMHSCITMNEVNRAIDQGYDGDLKVGNRQPKLLKKNMTFKRLPKGHFRRTAEVVVSMTVFPWEDNLHNYHATSCIYLLVKPANWQPTLSEN